MRWALLAILACAAPLAPTAAQASAAPEERAALKAVMSQRAQAAGHGVMSLPLRSSPRASATVGAALGKRLLVGARSHAGLPGLARRLRTLGARVETYETVAVLSVRTGSPSALAPVLRGDPRVAYVEPDRKLRTAADPFDAIDPATGVKFTWFYDDVRAADALAAAGGGSERSVAVVDTGLDVTHPELAGRVARRFDTVSRGRDVSDAVGHGTFVSGLIAAIDGNGVGTKGVAGNTRLVAVRASRSDRFSVASLIEGIEFAIRADADIVNMSLSGAGFTRSQARALEAAFFNDVLPVAASGNNGLSGNPLEYPAAAVGGRRGATGIGLSVAATRPNGEVASFSNHNSFVSLAAPGAGPSGCRFGVLSTLPATTFTAWDDFGSCSLVFALPEGRYGYGDGTSFAAPIVSGIAALVWQVEPRLASEQLAEVLTRSARQTRGSGWNEFSGAGIVDGAAATTLARSYDVTAPVARAVARRVGTGVRVRTRRARDRTEEGRELAGRVTYGLLVSRDGGQSFDTLARRRRNPISARVQLRGRRVNVLAATACDGNGNCGVRRLGRYRL